MGLYYKYVQPLFPSPLGLRYYHTTHEASLFGASMRPLCNDLFLFKSVRIPCKSTQAVILKKK